MIDLARAGREERERPIALPTPVEDLRRRIRSRRWRRVGVSGSVFALIITMIGLAALHAGSHSAERVESLRSPLPQRPEPVSLDRPSALAVGPNGNVFIADVSRNQILERLPDGGFVVIAGTGQPGYSGDGKAAVNAQVNGPAGMTFGPDGTLYFADSKNNRVRQISPDGVISTIAGTGAFGWVTDGTPALDAALGAPADVTFGPSDDLYIADQAWGEVLRLRAGVLSIAAGIKGPYGGIYGIGKPATQASADGANGIAFDASGNLFIAGSNTKTLLMVTTSGTMTLPIGQSSFYPRGDGGLVTDPDGHVLAMNTQAIVQLSPTGQRTLFDFGKPGTVSGIAGFLPNGVAVARDGTIFVDTWFGNGYTDKTALVKIDSTGRTSVLWKTPSP